MTGEQYVKVVGDVRAFGEAVRLIEEKIRKLNVNHGDVTPVGSPNGWPSYRVWESLKTASHFNLGIALELRLKCLLYLQGTNAPSLAKTHDLAEVYDRLPGKLAEKLEEDFRQSKAGREPKLTVLVNTSSPHAPNRPPNKPLDTLKNFLLYFDEDMQLWNKRYSWEGLMEERRYYLDDVDVFLDFLARTEQAGQELARDSGIIR